MRKLLLERLPLPACAEAEKRPDISQMRKLAEAAGASVSKQPPADADSHHAWLVIGNADAKTKEAAWAKKKLPTGQTTSGMLWL